MPRIIAPGEPPKYFHEDINVVQPGIGLPPPKPIPELPSADTATMYGGVDAEPELPEGLWDVNARKNIIEKTMNVLLGERIANPIETARLLANDVPGTKEDLVKDALKLGVYTLGSTALKGAEPAVKTAIESSAGSFSRKAIAKKLGMPVAEEAIPGIGQQISTAVQSVPRVPLAYTLPAAAGLSLGEQYLEKDSSPLNMGLTAGMFGGLAMVALPGGRQLLKAGLPSNLIKRVGGEEYLRGYENAKNWVWDNVVVPPFNPGKIPAIEALARSTKGTSAEGIVEWLAEKTPFDIPTYQGSGKPLLMKSLAEIMQPAVERMDPYRAGIFRNTARTKSLLGALGDEVGAALQEATPIERFDMIRMMRGYDVTPTPRLAEITSTIKTRMKEIKLTSPQEATFREQLNKLLEKNLNSPSETFAGEETSKVVQDITDQLNAKYGELSYRKVQKSLEQGMKDPTITPEVKTALKDLYDLPAQLPEDVGQSAQALTRAMLTEKLKNMKGVVRASVPAGREAEYLPSEWTAFQHGGKSLFVQRDVELELRGLQDIPKISHSVFNKWFMTPWKTAKVILRPATHIRNTISNAALNWMGGLSPHRMDIYTQAFNELKNEGKMWKEFRNITGSGGTYSLNDIMQLSEGLKYGANIFDVTLSWFDRASARPRAWYNAEEQLFKVAKYIYNREQGMGKSTAAWDAMKWTFNYGEVTPSTAWMRANMAPFFTWQSKIFPMMAEAAVKNPVAFTGAIALYQGLQILGIQNANISKDEWPYIQKAFPEYVKRGMFLVMPWRDDKGKLNLLNMTYMVPGFGDAAEIAGDPVGLMGAPWITMSAALLNNRKYSGAPIYYDWDLPGTKWAKGAKYFWEQLVPAPFIGGTDWNMLWKTFRSNDPSALSPTQAAAAMVGFKLSPIEEQEAQRQRRALINVHKAEIFNNLRSQLRHTTSEKEQEEIREDFRKIYEAFAKEQEVK